MAPPLLTSALQGREWSASRPDRFIPGKIALWMDGLDGPHSRFGRLGEESKSCPCRRLQPDFMKQSNVFTLHFAKTQRGN
jgi:hypothetical protein